MRTISHATTLLLAGLAAGCGEVTSFTDAGPNDGNTVDADTRPDAVPTGPVTVTATHACCTASGPAAGVEVIVVGPDGTVGATTQTGADGTATVEVTAGDSITTILSEGRDYYLTSHLAVEPGDHLRVGGNYRPQATLRGTMTVSWPAYGGSNYYYVYGPCDSVYVSATSPLTATYRFNSDCGTAAFDLAVVAYANNGNILGWRSLPNQTFTAGGALAVPALQTAGTFGVSLSGIPAEVTGFNTSINARLAGGGYATTGYVSAQPVGGAVNGAFPWATSGAGVMVQSSFYRQGNFAGQSSREVLPGTATSYNRTSVPMLPWVDYNVSMDLPARAVTWIQSGDAPYDGAAVNLQYSRQLAVVGGTFAYYRWTVVVPPGITDLQVPALPAAYRAHDLPAEDQVYPGVILFDRADADGYRGFRGAPTWELECPDCGQAVSLEAPAMRWSGQSGD